MKVSYQDHEGKELTGREMYRLAEIYSSDLGDFASWPFSAWFDYVRCIPYLSDEERFPSRLVELLSRPQYLLDRFEFPRIDCKKKAILLGAWAAAKRLPYRFIAVSHKPDKSIHHVFPQINFGDGWINADATFPTFRPGQPQPVTFAAELIK